jgi:hypothetical protein
MASAISRRQQSKCLTGEPSRKSFPLKVTSAFANRTDGLALAVDNSPGGVEKIDKRVRADRALQYFDRIRCKGIVSEQQGDEFG